MKTSRATLAAIFVGIAVFASQSHAQEPRCPDLCHPDPNEPIVVYDEKGGTSSSITGLPLTVEWPEPACQGSNKGFLIYRFEDRDEAQCALASGLEDTPPYDSVWSTSARTYVDRGVRLGMRLPVYLVRAWSGQLSCRGGQLPGLLPVQQFRVCGGNLEAEIRLVPDQGDLGCDANGVRAYVDHRFVSAPPLGTELYVPCPPADVSWFRGATQLPPNPLDGSLQIVDAGTYTGICRTRGANSAFCTASASRTITRLTHIDFGTFESSGALSSFPGDGVITKANESIPIYRCTLARRRPDADRFYILGWWAGLPGEWDSPKTLFTEAELLRDGVVVQTSAPLVDSSTSWVAFEASADGRYAVRVRARDSYGVEQCLVLPGGGSGRFQDIDFTLPPIPTFTINRLDCNAASLTRDRGIIEPSSWKWMKSTTGRAVSQFVEIDTPTNLERLDLALSDDPANPDAYYAIYAATLRPDQVECWNFGPDQFVKLSDPMPDLISIPPADGGRVVAACESVTLKTDQNRRGYSWTIALPGQTETFVIPGAHSESVVATVSGSYVASWIDEAGCRGFSDPLTVEIVGAPEISTSQTTDVVNLLAPSCSASPCTKVFIPGAIASFSDLPQADLAVRFEVLDDYRLNDGASDERVFRLSTGGVVRCGAGSAKPGCDGREGLFLSGFPDFGRSAIARIVVTQAGCSTLVTSGNDLPALYVAVGPSEVLSLPRAGTTYGGTRLRLFGHGIDNPGVACDPSSNDPTLACPEITVGGLSADYESSGSPTEVLAYTHAGVAGTDPWKDVSVCYGGACHSRSDLFRYVSFGIVSVDNSYDTEGNVVATGGAFLFDQGDWGAADFARSNQRFIDADPYRAGHQPAFSTGIPAVDVAFGKAAVAGLPPRAHSWVYVTEQARIARFDLAGYELDEAFGGIFDVAYVPCQSFPCGNPIGVPIPPYCRAILQPEYAFFDVDARETGHLSALVTRANVTQGEGVCSDQIFYSFQLWNENGDLGIPEQVIKTGFPYESTWPDRIAAIRKPTSATDERGRITFTFLRQMEAGGPYHFGLALFSAPPPNCPSCEGVSYLTELSEQVINPLELSPTLNWPSSHALALPTSPSTGCSEPLSLLSIVDPNRHAIRTFDLALASFRSSDVTYLGMIEGADVAAKRGLTNNFHSRLVVAYGSGPRAGKIQQFRFGPCGQAIPWTKGDQWEGAPVALASPHRVSRVALTSDAAKGVAVVPALKALVPFSVSTMTPIPNPEVQGQTISMSLPGQPFEVALQKIIAGNDILEANIEAIEHLPDQAWAALEKRVEVLADVRALSADLAAGNASANSLIGRSQAVRAKMNQALRNGSGKKVVVDHMTTLVDLLREEEKGSGAP